MVILCLSGPTAHHLVDKSPSRAYLGASASFTKLDASTSLFTEKLVNPDSAELVTVIKSFITISSSPFLFLAFNTTS